MIIIEQVFPLLLEACPSFRDCYEESVRDNGDELRYVHAGNFAYYLLNLYRANELGEFPAIGNLLERLYAEGDDDVQTLATVGILEGIQNGWSQSEVNPKVFLSYLGTVATKEWQALYRGWGG